MITREYEVPQGLQRLMTMDTKLNEIHAEGRS